MAKQKRPGFLQRLQQSTAAKLQQSSPAKSRHVVSKGTTSFHIDLRNIPDPERVYYATAAWCQYENTIAKFYFAQARRDSAGLRSVVCVHMSPEWAGQWLRSIAEMEAPSVEDIAATMGIVGEDVEELAGEPEQMVDVAANLARTSISGYEAALDFYKIPTSELVELKRGISSSPKVLPQVRVDMRTSLFIGLLDQVRELQEKFPQSGAVNEEE